MSTTNDIVERLRKLHEEATPAPWGWTTIGEKCNAAVLGTFHKFDDACTPLAGMVERYEFDEEKGDWVQVADWDEDIAYKEDNANYSDFDFICALRNALPLLLAEREAMRNALEAARTHAQGIARSGSRSCWNQAIDFIESRAALQPPTTTEGDAQ